jgi:integrase
METPETSPETRKRSITDAQLKAWTPGRDYHTRLPNESRQEVSAGNGLFVCLEPTGGVSWVTRARLHGKTVKVTLGRFGGGPDALNLTQAKKAHLDVRDKLKAGIDVRAERTKAKAEAADLAADTLRKISLAYVESRRKNPPKSLNRTARNLEIYVFPSLGNSPLGNIKRSEYHNLLERIRDKSGKRTAQVVYKDLCAVAKYYARKNDDYAYPFFEGFWDTTQIKRTRKFTDFELKAIWEASLKLGAYGAMLRFIMLTGARHSEASELQWDEIDGSTWTVPATRNKVGNQAKTLGKTSQHLTVVRPLMPTTLAILQERKGRAYPFGSNGHPILHRSSMRKKLDKLLEKLIPDYSKLERWVIHDLRSATRTLMTRAGVPKDHAELCLGHELPGMQGVYDRHDYLTEKTAAYQRLETLLLSIVNSTTPKTKKRTKRV